jgi:hypothetical protein
VKRRSNLIKNHPELIDGSLASLVGVASSHDLLALFLNRFERKGNILWMFPFLLRLIQKNSIWQFTPILIRMFQTFK